MTERLEDRTLLSGATLNWQGDVDASWSNAENWLEAAAPANGDVLVFDTATARFNAVTGGTGFRSINDLALSDVRLSLQNTSASDGFDLSGNSLTVKNYNPFIEYTGGGAGGAQIRLAGLTLTDSAGISTYNTGSSLVIESPINNAGFNLNATVQSFSQPLYLSVGISGIGGFNTGSGGVVVLDGANSFTGAVSHLAGTIRLADGQALADLVSVDLNGSSTTLEVTAAETIGSVNGLGKIVLGASLTTGGNNASTTLSGLVSGGGGLVKQGTGTFILSGANTYTGATTIQEGVLRALNTAAMGTVGTVTVGSPSLINATLDIPNGGYFSGKTLVLNGSGFNGLGALRGNGGWTGPIVLNWEVGVTVDASSVLSLTGDINSPGTASRNFNKDGSGLLVLSGNNTYNGPTQIFAGVVNVQSATALGSTVGHTSVGTGAALEIQNGINVTGETLFLNGSGSSSGGALRSVSGQNTWSGPITLGSNAAIAHLSTFFTVSATINTAGFELTYDTTTSNRVAQLTGVISGSGGLRVKGTGQVEVSVANTYSGLTTVQQGANTLQGGVSTLGDGTAGTVVMAGTTLFLNKSTAENITLNGTGKVFGALVPSNGANVSGTITLAGNTRIFSFGTGDELISGSITDAGQGYGIDFGANTPLQRTILAGLNQFTGTTTISSGSVLVNGSLSAGSNAVTVASGATLGGSGTISRPVVVTSGGKLAPGTSPGILNSGNVSLASGSTFTVELNGTTAGSGYDQLNVVGTVSLGGSTLAAVLGFSPPLGSTFVIVNNDGGDAVSGTFAGLAEGTSLTIGGQSFHISYVGGTGNDVVLTVVPRTAT